MNCRKCGTQIPAIRLEALPGTDVCVRCSDEPKRVGFMVYGHKTAGECVMIDARNSEALRQAIRADRRAR